MLLALANGASHGYGIIQDIEAETGSSVRTGTLYTVLQRLVEEAFIEERTRRPAKSDDPRRHYYELTSLGRTVLAAEADVSRGNPSDQASFSLPIRFDSRILNTLNY